MLKQLMLENWKSFRYAELPLDPLTVLIGTNASGKSNVVEALEFLQRIAKGENIEAALTGDKTLPSLRGGVEWAALKPETQFILKLLVQGEDNKTDYFYSITVQSKPSVHIVQEYLEKQKKSSDFQVNDEILIDNNFLTEKSYLSEVNHLFAQRQKEQEDIKLKLSNLNNTNQDLLETVNKLKNSIFINEVKVKVIENIENIKKQTNDLMEKTYEDDNNLDFISQELKLMNIIINKISSIFILNPIPSKMRGYSPLSNILESDGSNIAGVLAALDGELWNSEQLKQLATEWPTLASRKISIGDATIKTVAEYYAKTSSTFQVEIFTGDGGLKAYEPVTPAPRRRSSRKKG